LSRLRRNLHGPGDGETGFQMHNDIVDIRRSGVDRNARGEPFAGLKIIRCKHVRSGGHAEVELAVPNGAGQVDAYIGIEAPLDEIDAAAAPFREPGDDAAHVHGQHLIHGEIDLRFASGRKVSCTGGAAFERTRIAGIRRDGLGCRLGRPVLLIHVSAENISSAREVGDTVIAKIVGGARAGLLEPGSPVNDPRPEHGHLRAHHRVALIVEHFPEGDGLRDELRL
jgi:hypothetical protein